MEQQLIQLFGWFINESCCPLLEESIDLDALQALRKYYAFYSTETRAKVIDLHLKAGVNRAAQSELLTLIVSALDSSEEEERQKIAILISNLLDLIANNNFDNWDSLKTLFKIKQNNNKKLDIVLARGVGLWAVSNETILTNIVNDLLEGESRNIQLNRDAIDEAFCNNGGNLFVAILLKITNSYSDIPKQRRNLIIALFHDRILKQKKSKSDVSEINSNILRVSSLISLQYRRNLVGWLAPLEQEDTCRFLGILITLSDDLPEVEQKVTQLINQLGKAANTIISKMPFVPKYVLQGIQIIDNDKASREILVKIHSENIKTAASEEDISKLINQAKDNSRSVAFSAAQELMNFVVKQNYPNVDDWISILEKSNISGVRRCCLDALNQLVDQNLTDEHLTRIWVNICAKFRKSSLQETQKTGDLLARWIHVNNSLPTSMTKLVDGLIKCLDSNPNGKIAGALFNIFKEITRTQQKTELSQKLIEWTNHLLTIINIKTIKNGQSEVSQVLRLINDLNSEFLPMLVESCCPKMSPEIRSENVCAVVEAIQKCGGKQLVLLENIRNSNWCPEKALILISKFRLKA